MSYEHRVLNERGVFIYFFPGSVMHGLGSFDHLMSDGQRVERRTKKWKP